MLYKDTKALDIGDLLISRRLGDKYNNLRIVQLDKDHMQINFDEFFKEEWIFITFFDLSERKASYWRNSETESNVLEHVADCFVPKNELEIRIKVNGPK